MTWLDRRGASGPRPPEASERPEQREVGHALIPLDELPPGTVAEVVADGRTLAVANVDGELLAVDGVCPHAGGPLGDGHLEGCVLTCPWHGWSYDLKTGQSLVSEDVKLETFAVEVVDGVVTLSG